MAESGLDAIPVSCPCGTLYHFKSEYGGALLQCPSCRQVFRVPRAPGDGADDSPLRRFLARRQALPAEVVEAEPPPPWRQVYELRQRVWEMDECYDLVPVPQGGVLATAERGLRLANVAVFVLLTVALFAGALSSPERAELWLGGGVALAGLIALRFKFFRRDVVFWSSADRVHPEFVVRDVRRLEFPRAEFRVEDKTGRVLGRLSKPWLGDLLRSPWRIYDAGGALALVAREESLVLSLLSRLFFLKLWWFRTNFVLVDPETDESCGEFRRRWKLADHYVLDLSGNRRELDVRVLWALAVLLDSAERR